MDLLRKTDGLTGRYLSFTLENRCYGCYGLLRLKSSNRNTL
nr:MAG TPA: hypothetical protein [Caudoviricetes sp.]